MPRADRQTESGPNRARAADPSRIAAPYDAINETERLLCGPAAVSRPAVAEGLALQGSRAATLLAPSTAGQLGSDTASARVAWVHHRSGFGTNSGFAFELASSIAQDAIDHCLVARDLAQRLGAPGLCSFAPPPSGSLDRVVLPGTDLIDEFDSGLADLGGATPGDDESVLAGASLSFRRVSDLTGRPISPVTVDGAGDAECVLVSSAASRSAAQRLARSLLDENIPCRIVCIHLVRPFPEAALSQALAGARRLLVIPAGDGFSEAIRGVLNPGSLDAFAILSEVPGSEAAFDSARRVFGGEAPVEFARKPLPHGSPLALTARPAGVWADRLLLDVASRLDQVGDMAFAREPDTLIVGRHPVEPPRNLPVDVALCAHPSYIETAGLLLRLARGATLVVVSTGPVPESWWERLRPEKRAILLEREAQVHWLDLGAAPSLDLADPDAVRAVVLDGFVAAGALSLAETLEQTLNDFDAPGAMTRLDIASLESTRAARERDFKPEPPPIPRMPREETGADQDRWRDAARSFHLTGKGAHSAIEPTLAEPLHPLVFDAIDTPARQGTRYPLFVRFEAGADSKTAIPFETFVSEILEADGTNAGIVGQHLSRLSRAVGHVMSGKPGPVDTGPPVTEASLEFESGFDLTDAGRKTLREETKDLRRKLEAAASGLALVGLQKNTLLCLHTAAVRRARRERWEPLLAEIGSLAQSLEELIALDEGHDPEKLSAEAVESTLGGDTGSFFDPTKLAASLRRQRGPQRLGQTRRDRIDRALAALRHGLGDDARTDLILVRPEAGPASAGLPGVREIVHPRGLGAAIGMFDGLAARYANLFRALRVGRLEVDNAYDPALHDTPLARLEWEGLSEDELLSLPRLVVLETDARLRGAGLGALSELLRSGRPVHVLVEQGTSEFRAAEAWQGLAGFHPGLGYLAVAHREAFVIESSLVCPDRLVSGLERMARSLRPGAAFVAVPSWQATVHPWGQLLAAEQARAVPCFTYDPEAGPNWAERFDLNGNPQPLNPWPLHAVRYIDDQGVETTIEQGFTFAHAIALDPAYRGHFRIIPEEAWSAEQMELVDYLAAPIAAVARKIPFIWVVIDGRMARALVTRELAFASRDRLRAWHILQELAGTDNEYVRRAAETARGQARAEAEITEKVVETEHSAEVERVRAQAARTAIEKLARVLVGVEEAPGPIRPAPAPNEMEEATAGATNVEEVAPSEEAPTEPPSSAVIVDPYIDSMLCTSCADCVNINPRLFKYDENKQAFIEDATQGTFAQLVKAAEKCPARCIHPGQPAAGDTTANKKLIARAAKFNG